MTNPQTTPVSADTAAAAPEKPPENPLLHHLEMNFSAGEIEPRINAALQAQQKKITLPGFRRGKVPLSVLRRHYGKATLHEVLREAAAPKFHQELEERKQRAAAAPRLQLPDIATAEVYTVQCDYEILPDIAAPDFSDKTIKKPMFTVTDEAVEEMINTLRQQRGTYHAAAAVVDDDEHRVRADFQSVLLPQSDEEEEKVIESGKDHPFYLGKKGRLYPQLRDKLLTVTAGESCNVDIPMPEDAANKELSGRTMSMRLQVKAVEQLHRAELNEEFFSFFGDEEKTLESFRQSVQQHLERESKVRLRNFLHSRAMNVLMGATTPFPLPQSMLINEAYRLLQQAQEEWKQRGMAESAAGFSLQMFFPEAQRRVALGLILSAWQRREDVSIDKDALETRLLEIAEAYEDPSAAAAKIRGDKNEMEAVYLSVLEDRVTDWVCENCTVEEEEMTLADFLSDSGGAA